MHRAQLLRACVSVTLGVLMGWGCHTTETSTALDTGAPEVSPAAAGPALSSVRYALSLVYGRAKKREDGGFSVTNDRGYAITVTSGYLVSYSVSLVHCAKKTGALPPHSPLSFGIPSAHAGHSGVMDPSAMLTPHVESLAAPSILDVDTIVFPAASYCQLHYLVARANDKTAGMPEDVAMSRLSLRLRGHYRAPGAAEDVALDLSTAAANGSVIELAPLLGDAGCKENARLDVIIERDLGSLFDGADFAKEPHGVLEHRLLQNLITHTRVTASCT